MCSICQEIFNTPVTTTCCLQLFCEECITKWLTTNTTCPYDRKPLTRSGLSKPPRLVTNTLGRFKIRCDYWAHGCQDVVKLDDLTKHTVDCRYKDAKCPKCQCDRTSGHDCIVALLAESNQFKKKYSGELAVYKAFINKAKVEIEALKQALKRANDALKNAHATNNTDDEVHIPDHELLVVCRRQLSTPEFLTNTMDTEMTAKTLAIIRAQVTKQKNLFNVCKQIANDMDEEFGTSWHCLADRGKAGVAYYTPDRSTFMRVKIASITLILFRTVTSRLDSQIIDDDDIDIVQDDMKPIILEMVREITCEAIESADTLDEIAKNIKNKMKSRYYLYDWQCFVGLRNSIGRHVTYQPNSFISYDLDELRVVLFQA
ncbi:unnamed protein product, partial [Medioppia subpectinata]